MTYAEETKDTMCPEPTVSEPGPTPPPRHREEPGVGGGAGGGAGDEDVHPRDRQTLLL